jgi:hypothetical protein
MCLVDEAYKKVKVESKRLLEVSKDLVGALASDIREEYDEIERKRMEHDKACRAAVKERQTPPSTEGVDVRSLDELKEELETQKANLELNSITNPGVIEQYERRKQEVSAVRLVRSMVAPHCIRLRSWRRTLMKSNGRWRDSKRT